MGAFLGVLGSLGIVIGGGWMIFNKVKKRSLRVSGIVLSVSVVFFISGLIISPSAGNVEADATVNGTNQSTTLANTTVLTDTTITTAAENITFSTTTSAPVKATSAVKTTKAATAKTTAVKKVSRTVYITPTGKRYHYSSSCNGGSYSASTLDEAKSIGLTPCKKCIR